MTGAAFQDGNVFIFFNVPAFSVGVAVDASAGIVGARGFWPVTRVAFGNGRMVKFQWCPTVESMAVGAFAGKVVGVIVRGGGLVAACTISGCSGVTAVFMAGQAVNLSVTAVEREVGMFDILPQERDDDRVDPGSRFHFIGQRGNQLVGGSGGEQCADFITQPLDQKFIFGSV